MCCVKTNERSSSKRTNLASHKQRRRWLKAPSGRRSVYTTSRYIIIWRRGANIGWPKKKRGGQTAVRRSSDDTLSSTLLSFTPLLSLLFATARIVSSENNERKVIQPHYVVSMQQARAVIVHHHRELGDFFVGSGSMHIDNPPSQSCCLYPLHTHTVIFLPSVCV